MLLIHIAFYSFQKSNPQQDKSREFDSNCNSYFSSYFNTVASKGMYFYLNYGLW